MSNVNIPRSVEDPFYRYTRQTIKLKHIAKNGGMTVLENLDQIALAIGVQTSFLAKVIMKGLNTSLVKVPISLRGVFSSNDIENIIESFIIAYVICPNCDNPEFLEKKKKRICKACGHTRK